MRNVGMILFVFAFIQSENSESWRVHKTLQEEAFAQESQ